MENTEMALTVVEADRTPQNDFQWTEEDMQALRATVAKDCNPAQFRVFVVACQRLQLDPFARQIVPIVQAGRMTPQTTIDGFRLIAERTHKYAGQIGPFWCGADGEWHDVWLPDGDPVACKVGILRRDFSQPMWGIARMKSYKQPSSPTWQKMPDVMIAKVAESLGLRKAFPQELSGAYTEEEMAQAALDVTPVAPATPETRTAPDPQAAQPAPAAQSQAAKPATKAALAASDRKAPPAQGSVRLLGRQCGYESQADYDAMVVRVTHKSKGWTAADQWLVWDFLTEKQAIDAQRAADAAQDEPEMVFEEATA